MRELREREGSGERTKRGRGVVRELREREGVVRELREGGE